MSMTTEPRPTVEDWRPRWSRAVVVGSSVIVVLLLGAALGMFLTQRALGGDEAVPTAGSVDVGFAQDMSTHHTQAVTMANWERDHTTDPQLKQLAFDIESTQLDQIGRMKGWLMLWGQPEQSTGPPMVWMAKPAGHDGMTTGGSPPTLANGLMPGMATDAELAKLRTLSGKELDVYFLQLMLRHHRDGTDMAQYAHDHAAQAAVRTLAQSMLVSQAAEMDQMKLMLAIRGAQPLP